MQEYRKQGDVKVNNDVSVIVHFNIIMILENKHFSISINAQNGAVDSFYIKKTNCELIGEKRLSSLFSLCAQTKDCLCNYADSSKQKAAKISLDDSTVTIEYHKICSEMGELDTDVTAKITLSDDKVLFSAELINNSDSEISEFWFPQIGGITRFDENRDAKMAVPAYLDCRHSMNPIKDFPGALRLGSIAAEWCATYPGIVMPWIDIHDPATDTGLYFGYHDTTMRFCNWHMYMYPDVTEIPGRSMFTSEEACGEPVGIVFSHVRYPFLKKGETFSSGEFIIRVHDGDWHTGSKYYREWFLKHFPFDKKNSWLRKKSAWFSSIIYQPEDKIIADYETYNTWCKDAEKYGIDCHEIIGWDKGGLERDYPEYVPEEKLGGKEGFRSLLQSIRSRNSRSLVFVNYNILDSCSEWYKNELHRYAHQDPFGNTPNWMCWGESTLLARNSVTARRHHLASVIPEMEQILEEYFLEIVRSGASGLQIDKLNVGSRLDFNPLNSEKPDTASCEGLVQAIGRMLDKCREINPEFCLAGEAIQDRLIPYVDVYYRAAEPYTISPLKYVFPEWTSCIHVMSPLSFYIVNSAVMTGAVICAEPKMYQGSMAWPVWRKMAEYIAETERIRKELADVIFTGEYCDTLYGSIKEVSAVNNGNSGNAQKTPGSETIIPDGGVTYTEANSGCLHYRVHRSWDQKQMAIVVANDSAEKKQYTYQPDLPAEKEALLYSPFCEPKTVSSDNVLTIDGSGLHIILMNLR